LILNNVQTSIAAFDLSLLAAFVYRLWCTLPPSVTMTGAQIPMDTSALRLLVAVLHRPLTTLAQSALLTKAPSPMATTHA